VIRLFLKAKSQWGARTSECRNSFEKMQKEVTKFKEDPYIQHLMAQRPELRDKFSSLFVASESYQ
jgi:hypothetical protein